MSLIIFFGIAAFIAILGFIVIGVTVYQWIQQSREAKILKINLQKPESEKITN
jgi:hypothetical protein